MHGTKFNGSLSQPGNDLRIICAHAVDTGKEPFPNCHERLMDTISHACRRAHAYRKGQTGTSTPVTSAINAGVLCTGTAAAPRPFLHPAFYTMRPISVKVPFNSG